MKSSVIIAASCLLAQTFVVGCATPPSALAPPPGEEIAPGMTRYSEAAEDPKQLTSATSPWEPNAFYPALETGVLVAPVERSGSVTDAESARGARPMATRSSGGATAKLFFEFYSNTWSRADGSTCRFSPTCSGFGRQAIARHGVLGVVMTFGRLHKNHSDADFYDAEGSRLLDPVFLNTFWFREPSADEAREEAEIGAYLQLRDAARAILPPPPKQP